MQLGQGGRSLCRLSSFGAGSGRRNAGLMSAVYRQVDVRLEGSGSVHASFEIQNVSSETWRSSEGFALGYHIFDPDTGTLIVDGHRLAPGADVAPGESAPMSLHFELPPEPGRYRIFVSPMREHVCWYYERGWPFLLIDAVVDTEKPRLERVRVANARVIRREQMARSLVRAVVYPVLTVWRNRGLIRAMVRRDILGRYRGSFGGALWTLLNPLLLMVTYFFVFGVVLQTRFGPEGSRTGFALYFLAGMLPWLAFSEAAGRAPSVMLEHRSFVKKLVFAVEILPVNLVVSGLVSEIFGLLIFLAAFVLTRGAVPASLLWLPVLIVPQVLFTAGLCWFLAALGVFARDLGQIIGFLLTLWFFLTPICYPENSLPQMAVPILSKSPLFVLVRGYRAIFLERSAPAFGAMWKLWLLSIVVFIAGHAWFYKLRKSFADII
jgi:lipopolysaccharide transport system permease protein